MQQWRPLALLLSFRASVKKGLTLPWMKVRNLNIMPSSQNFRTPFFWRTFVVILAFLQTWNALCTKNVEFGEKQKIALAIIYQSSLFIFLRSLLQNVLKKSPLIYSRLFHWVWHSAIYFQPDNVLFLCFLNPFGFLFSGWLGTPPP